MERHSNILCSLFHLGKVSYGNEKELRNKAEYSEGFNDGFGENLIGDEEDQMRLVNMNEKEREMEPFARSAKREVLKTRYEIERKLRMAKKKEMMQSQIKMRKRIENKAEGWDEDSEGFNGVYEENLIGDEEDQMRLVNMNEKEREMELFARSEKREVLKTRYEIERKLRMAKKKEMIQRPF
uniref:Uncharacterized protein n=1 Tax=Tetranychus urticae TaxID=32264 RepID=T1JZQ7_TETUR